MANNKVKIFFFEFILIFLGYCLLLQKMHFSIDTYTNYFYHSPCVPFMSGRYINYLLGTIFNYMGINAAVNQRFFTVLMIAVLAYAALKLVMLYLVEFKRIAPLNRICTIAVMIAVSISFLNVFLLEWFFFPESLPYYAICILAAVGAVIVLNKNTAFINIIIAILLIVVVMFSYQIALPMFVIWSLVLTLLKSNFHPNKQFFKNSIITLGVGFTGSLIAILSKTLITNMGVGLPGRSFVTNLSTIWQNCKNLIKFQFQLWYRCENFLPHHFLVICGFAALILLCTKYRALGPKKFFTIILVLLACYAMVFLPHTILDVSWFVSRTIVGFFSFWSVLWIVLLFLYRDKKDRIKFNIVLGFTALFVLVNIWCIWGGTIDQFDVNTQDYCYIQSLENEIIQYEQDSGIEVKNIIFHNDTSPVYRYKTTKYTDYDINTRAVVQWYAVLDMFKYFTGNTYQGYEMDEATYTKYFEQKNWDYFIPEEQLIFEGDTLYLAIY